MVSPACPVLLSPLFLSPHLQTQEAAVASTPGGLLLCHCCSLFGHRLGYKTRSTKRMWAMWSNSYLVLGTKGEVTSQASLSSLVRNCKADWEGQRGEIAGVGGTCW